MPTLPTQNFTELDFDTIKQNLKDYLASRPEFVDFNFDGTFINLIIEMLAYNAQHQGFYANMLGAEFFLDTAQRRESVVSRAKEIGYTPRSTTSAFAVLDIVLESSNNALTSLTIPANTIWTTTVNDTTYKFQTLEAYTSTTFNDILGVRYFTFEDVYLYEGNWIRSSNIIDPSNISGIVIPNSKVDTSRMNVYVAPSNNFSLSVQYSFAESFIDLNNNSTVYFLEEINDELTKVYFGDGVTGIPVSLGNLVTIDYLVSNGKAANGATEFTLSSAITNVTSMESYTVVSAAAGGADIESVESVRFNAPLAYSAQNRAVTAKDYIAIINNNYSFKSVYAWGGETNSPPALGYVFISIKPDDINDTISDIQKQTIEQFLIDNYCVGAILPIIVDAEFIHLSIAVNVKYNPNILTSNAASLAAKVETVIRDYVSDDLGRFNQYFRFSKLSRQIDESDLAINNNNMTVTMIKRTTPSLSPSALTVDFANAVVADTLSTNTFGYEDDTNTNYTDVFAEADDGGVVSLKRYDGLDKVTLSGRENIGQVDELTGRITFALFEPTSLNGITNDIRWSIRPANQDVYPVRNTIVTVNTDDIVSVTTTPDTIN